MATTLPRKFAITRVADLPPVACPCGTTRRAFVDDPDRVASLHVVDVSVDARTHYHKRLTEIYYILEGEGEMELDGERYPVRPGDSIRVEAVVTKIVKPQSRPDRGFVSIATKTLNQRDEVVQTLDLTMVAFSDPERRRPTVP